MRSIIIAIAIATATPALATQADADFWVRLMKLVEICTVDPDKELSEAEIKACVFLEQQLRAHGKCMYSPGVLGLWTGKDCR